MDATSILSDGSALNLFARAAALTLFYAALFWLPMRGTVGLLQRIRQVASRKAPPGSATRS